MRKNENSPMVRKGTNLYLPVCLVEWATEYVKTLKTARNPKGPSLSLFIELKLAALKRSVEKR